MLSNSLLSRTLSISFSIKKDDMIECTNNQNSIATVVNMYYRKYAHNKDQVACKGQRISLTHLFHIINTVISLWPTFTSLVPIINSIKVNNYWNFFKVRKLISADSASLLDQQRNSVAWIFGLQEKYGVSTGFTDCITCLTVAVSREVYIMYRFKTRIH